MTTPSLRPSHGVVAAIGILAATAGCQPKVSTLPPATKASPVEVQIALGKEVYIANCAGCHGDAGEGSSKAPRMVGMKKKTLPLDPPANRKYRKTQFRTALDVAKFAIANIPPKAEDRATMT